LNRVFPQDFNIERRVTIDLTLCLRVMLCPLWHSENTENTPYPPLQARQPVKKFAGQLIKRTSKDKVTIGSLNVAPNSDKIPLILKLSEPSVKSTTRNIPGMIFI
jgi:hypothetical protein